MTQQPAADFLLSGKVWPGPRRGVNWAGYIAWAAGYSVGMLGNICGIPQSWKDADHPASLCFFIVAFVA
jgi:cytosine permease